MSAKKWVPSPGHIVHAHVQYSDSEKTKARFPVVVSSSAFNEMYPDVIVAYTTRTSNINHPRSYDVEISDRHPDFDQTGLPNSTTVRCGRLWSVSQKKIASVIGIVPEDILNDIQRMVLECFDRV